MRSEEEALGVSGWPARLFGRADRADERPLDLLRRSRRPAPGGRAPRRAPHSASPLGRARREAHDAVAEPGHTTTEQRRRFEAPFALSVGARCAPESKGEQRTEESARRRQAACAAAGLRPIERRCPHAGEARASSGPISALRPRLTDGAPASTSFPSQLHGCRAGALVLRPPSTKRLAERMRDWDDVMRICAAGGGRGAAPPRGDRERTPRSGARAVTGPAQPGRGGTPR